MPAPKEPLWDLPRHTAAKHQLLIGYLNAWLAILGSWAEDVWIIDGFAGPGEYRAGEPGSPVLMLDALLNHSALQRMRARFHFLFIEADEARYKHLAARLATRDLTNAPVQLDIVHGDFAETFPQKLAEAHQRFGEMPPTFAFIDPFGAGDDVAHLASTLVNLPRCEALVYVPINYLARFVEVPDMHATLDRLYDGKSWLPACAVPDTASRRQILQDAYITRLQKSCKWVRPFEITPSVGGNSYTLFFGTNHEQGLRRMKDAMWKVDPIGGAGFRDSTLVGAPVLFESKPDLDRLERELRREFGTEPFSIERAEYFTLTKTAYRDNGHLKPALKIAEKTERLEPVEVKEGRRPCTYPSGTVVRFV